MPVIRLLITGRVGQAAPGEAESALLEGFPERALRGPRRAGSGGGRKVGGDGNGGRREIPMGRRDDSGGACISCGLSIG